MPHVLPLLPPEVQTLREATFSEVRALGTQLDRLAAGSAADGDDGAAGGAGAANGGGGGGGGGGAAEEQDFDAMVRATHGEEGLALALALSLTLTLTLTRARCVRR